MEWKYRLKRSNRYLLFRIPESSSICLLERKRKIKYCQNRGQTLSRLQKCLMILSTKCPNQRPLIAGNALTGKDRWLTCSNLWWANTKLLRTTNLYKYKRRSHLSTMFNLLTKGNISISLEYLIQIQRKRRTI